MKSRAEFCSDLAKLTLTVPERAIALLWFYRQTKEFEERSPTDLASDLHKESFPKPNVTHLKDNLAKNKQVTKGKQKGTFQLDARYIAKLDEKYLEMFGEKQIVVTGDILPLTMVAGTRQYLEQMVYQLNGCYESGFYDGCAVLCRRLMESLIIEIYINNMRKQDIQQNGVFMFLDSLIKYISSDKAITLGRNTPKTMLEIKVLGDTAAHDRTYITLKQDVDDLKAKYRRMIAELLTLSGVK